MSENILPEQDPYLAPLLQACSKIDKLIPEVSTDLPFDQPIRYEDMDFELMQMFSDGDYWHPHLNLLLQKNTLGVVEYHNNDGRIEYDVEKLRESVIVDKIMGYSIFALPEDIALSALTKSKKYEPCVAVECVFDEPDISKVLHIPISKIERSEQYEDLVLDELFAAFEFIVRMSRSKFKNSKITGLDDSIDGDRYYTTEQQDYITEELQYWWQEHGFQGERALIQFENGDIPLEIEIADEWYSDKQCYYHSQLPRSRTARFGDVQLNDDGDICLELDFDDYKSWHQGVVINVDLIKATRVELFDKYEWQEDYFKDYVNRFELLLEGYQKDWGMDAASSVHCAIESLDFDLEKKYGNDIMPNITFTVTKDTVKAVVDYEELSNRVVTIANMNIDKTHFGHFAGFTIDCLEDEDETVVLAARIVTSDASMDIPKETTLIVPVMYIDKVHITDTENY